MEYLCDSPTILLLENDPELQDLICDVLSLLRYKPETFPNTSRLLERLREMPMPNLVIAGHREMVSIGRDFVEEIRTAGYLFPLVLIGGGSNRIFNPEAWRRNGVLVQLTTPISIDDLIWVIERALQVASPKA